ARRETIEARNQLDALVYTVSRTLDENRAALGAEHSSRLESALESAKSALEGSDKDAMTRAAETLQQASHQAAEVLDQSQAAGQPGQAAEGEVKDAEVVDAEYAETR